MKLTVLAIGVLGPGLADWPGTRAVLRGDLDWSTLPTAIPAPGRLPAAERRRVGTSVKLALAVAEQLFASGPWDPSQIATVFASSGGDAENCHALCEALSEAEPQLSPTRFTNSVHNAPAGYWSIAMQSKAASSSLCAHDASFSAGLFEAAIYAHTEDEPVALIAYDVPYPEPLASKRPIGCPFGVALLIAPGHETAGLAWLELDRHCVGTPDPATPRSLETLRSGVPAARCLPLLAAVARGESGEVALEAVDNLVLTVSVQPCP